MNNTEAPKWDAGNDEATRGDNWWAQHDEMLAKWEEAKRTLEAAKNSEMELREAYAQYAFPADKRKEGVNTLELANGYEAKLTHTMRYSITGTLDEVEAVEEKFDEGEGQFLIERIISWKPQFSKSEYNKLDVSLPIHKNVKDAVDSILTVKPGAPSLTIKEPKAKLNG